MSETKYKRNNNGYGIKGQKSPGFCTKCRGDWDDMIWGHRPKNCRNPPFCEYHDVFGHAPTHKCRQWCSYCRHSGHTMQFCHKLKNCDLCGKLGHNPKRCWRYHTILQWMQRAKELGRCGECLTLFTADEKICTNCYNTRVYWNPEWQSGNCKESQTEENSHIIQECQTELQEGKTIIEELNSKILELENKLKSSNTAINELNWQWQNTVQEKEQELQKVNKLNSLCKDKEMELKRLWEQITQKDIELEQHRERKAQPTQIAPAAAQQPCPASASNNLGHFNESNCIRPTLVDLQDQQQKLCVMVNQLYNKVMTQNMSLLNYSGFNPYMGLYDTGQYFNKL